ncbi:MAG TPA: hypothetical protein VND65_20870 [Candidatus Binatia bacterium]|nr:hypothetical protein [Candidatus Binatia bacterium]
MRKANSAKLLLLVVAVSGSIAAAQVQANPAPKDKGPSYEDTIKWIEGHIGESGFPTTTSKSHLGLVFTVSDAPFAMKFDGCDMRLSLAMQLHTADTSPLQGKAENDMTGNQTSSITFNLHLARVGVVSEPQNLPVQGGIARLIDEQYLNKNFPTVVVEGVDAGAGTFSDSQTTTDSNTELPQPIFNRPIAENTMVPFRVFSGYGVGRLVKGIQITYARPGTEDSPKHMINALQHLIDLCKENPNAGPKDLF